MDNRAAIRNPTEGHPHDCRPAAQALDPAQCPGHDGSIGPVPHRPNAQVPTRSRAGPGMDDKRWNATWKTGIRGFPSLAFAQMPWKESCVSPPRGSKWARRPPMRGPKASRCAVPSDGPGRLHAQSGRHPHIPTRLPRTRGSIASRHRPMPGGSGFPCRPTAARPAWPIRKDVPSPRAGTGRTHTPGKGTCRGARRTFPTGRSYRCGPGSLRSASGRRRASC